MIPALPAAARVLDCGGWFIPLAAATHVVDLMPYETRGGELRPGPLPGECFTRDTWHQLDFLAPDLRLPFPDKFFAFSWCSHTLEDLADPEPLLRELLRVSAAGHLATPSRLDEQTVGARDRMTSRPGHPHHHWIAETENGVVLLSHKADSLAGRWWRTAIPLALAERLHQAEPGAKEWTFSWRGEFEWKILRGPEARARADAFSKKLGVTAPALAADWARRKLRRLKYASIRPDTAAWWEEMVRLSQPYSRLPLT